MRAWNALLFAALFLAEPTEAAQVLREDTIAECMKRASTSLGFSGTAYVRSGELVVERSFGMSDADGKVPNTGQTRFNIGSANKMFVAVAIGMLVDRNTVQFDAPIGRFFSGLRPELANITIAQLLEHTSGLGDYFRPENRPAIERAKTATDLLPLAISTSPAFAPGTKRAYSNAGYVVLGAIIEKVSGQTWGAFVQKNILDPTGMNDTRFDSVGGAVPMSHMSATGRLDRPRPSLGPLMASPAGGMFSTPSDLSRFLTALVGGRLISKSTLDTLLTPRPDPEGGPGTSGYGFLVRAKPTPRIGIGGGAPGVNADIAYFPNTGLQFISLSNVDPPVATEMDNVLEYAVSAQDTASACVEAIASPKLRNPSLMVIIPDHTAGAEKSQR